MAKRLKLIPCLFTAAFAVFGSAAPSSAATLLVDLSGCLNVVFSAGQPVGRVRGNAQTDAATLRFDLRDPAAGDNAWRGAAGTYAAVRMAVTEATAVDLLLNTYAGQAGVTNAIVVLEGTNGFRKVYRLIGNRTIRDYDNGTFTNTIDGRTTQEWWTNKRRPRPGDGSHRLDAVHFDIAALLGGETLTKVKVKATPDAGVDFMQPLLVAMNVVYDGTKGRPPSCSVH